MLRIAAGCIVFACTATVQAQSQSRLPVIAGEMGVNHQSPGGPKEWQLTPVPFFKVRLGD